VAASSGAGLASDVGVEASRGGLASGIGEGLDASAGGCVASGAVVLAGLATFIVVAIWFAFYLLVFVPRAGAP